MTANEYQIAAMRTARTDAFDGDELLANAALGLCGEAGEVADLIKKHLYQGHELYRERLIEELGDVAWYLALCARSIGCDLETILRGNIDKLLRRYPEGFDAERSRNRGDGK